MQKSPRKSPSNKMMETYKGPSIQTACRSETLVKDGTTLFPLPTKNPPCGGANDCKLTLILRSVADTHRII